MRIVVTGASGFLGNNLVRSLLAEDHCVVAADQTRSPALNGLDVHFTKCDVLDPASLRAAFEGADAIFNLAAIISIGGETLDLMTRVNVEGPRNVARAAYEASVGRLVHCSSVHAFDLRNCGPSLDESGPRTTRTSSPLYDQTKYAGELEIQSAIAKGLDAVIVNPTGVFGPRDFGPSHIGETLRQLRNRKIPVTIVGGFDFVDVRDVVKGMMAALKLGQTGENYLLSGTRVSIQELGQMVATVQNMPPPKLNIPLRLVKPFVPLVKRFTPAGAIPIFTEDSLHALKYSPTVSHYKAALELGYTARPIHTSIADSLRWLDSIGTND